MRKICIILLALTLTACAQTNVNKEFNKLQDTNAAVRYFKDELNHTVNPVGTKYAIQSNQNIVIVDVRREADFKLGHIPGAINLPFDKWDGFEGSQTEFPGLKKDAFNYVYCYELLCNLSQKAAMKFVSLGYPSKEIKGGFQSWREHKYPIEK